MDTLTSISRTTVRMTEYSHGSECGCKIAPKLLDEILKGQLNVLADPMLLVGNRSQVEPDAVPNFITVCREFALTLDPVGKLTERRHDPLIEVV
jgi:hypothetical protein